MASGSRPQGFAYIALLATLTIIMLTLGMAAENISHTAKREREEQLLFVGAQFRSALESYYEKSPQGGKQYPKTLGDLLLDNRFPQPAKHLRRIYADPMTGSTEWGLVRNTQGRIVGIYSLSGESPIKTRFDAALQRSFGSRPLLAYSDWKFVYTPGGRGADLAKAPGLGLDKEADKKEARVND